MIQVKISDGRIMLNLEDFVSDIENAMNKYFDELRSDDELFKLAQTRYDKLGILTIIELN